MFGSVVNSSCETNDIALSRRSAARHVLLHVRKRCRTRVCACVRALHASSPEAHLRLAQTGSGATKETVYPRAVVESTRYTSCGESSVTLHRTCVSLRVYPRRRRKSNRARRRRRRGAPSPTGLAIFTDKSLLRGEFSIRKFVGLSCGRRRSPFNPYFIATFSISIYLSMPGRNAAFPANSYLLYE